MKEALDFIVIGAQKSGTTSLFEYLTRHPELSLPTGKELPFFSDQDARERGWSDYMRKAFAFAEPDSRWGTVTPQYMVGGLLDTPNPSSDGALHDERTIPLRIREQIPEVHLIAILRDPVERALSHHRMVTMEGIEQRAFDEAIEQLLQADALEAARRSPQEETGYVAWGEYGRILSGYLEVFPREQILVLFTQDLEIAPEQLLARVHEFLGVSSDTMPENLGRRYRTGGSGRRLSWLRPYAIQRAVTQQNTMRTLWHKLPERTRRRIDRQFIRAAYGFDLWNRRRAHAAEEPDPTTMKRLQEHFAADAGRLEADFQLTVPWREPVSES